VHRLPFLCLLLAFSATPAAAAFSLTVSPGALTFPSVDVGQESAAQTINLQALSDDPMGWTLTLQANPLTNTDGFTQIPASNFSYWFTQSLPGTEVPPFPSAAAVPALSTTIYTGGASECASSACSFGLGFKIVADPVQKVGSYTTQVTLTLVSGI
jgi:hypothetical protein